MDQKISELLQKGIIQWAGAALGDFSEYSFSFQTEEMKKLFYENQKNFNIFIPFNIFNIQNFIPYKYFNSK